MITNLINFFKDKKILILGFGKEGISTYNLIRKYLPKQQLYIADKKDNFQNDFNFLKNDIYSLCISGEKYIQNLDNYEIIMKSPGISLAHVDISKYISKITSQLELLLEFYKNYTIGITGTKGKSTTSSLIHKILKDQNIRSILLGNIGTPVFEYIDTIKKGDIIVLEMSSHQLEYMNLSPNIAILLNIYEEHLDHYNSFYEYAKAKCNIYKYQKEDDYFLYNVDNNIINKIIKKTHGITYKVSLQGKKNSNIYLKENKIFFNEKPIYNKNENRSLLGDYNLNNIMFALGVSEILNLNIEQTKKSINEFKTLAHRLELVGIYDGIIYYDNSIGTVPSATIEAVKTLKYVDTLIIGGMDRGINFKEFILYLNSSTINNIICMPKTGHDIAKKIKKERRYIANNLEEAVKIAKKVTQKGKICLLSPTAASYGFFKNFEEKGDLYKKLVKST